MKLNSKTKKIIGIIFIVVAIAGLIVGVVNGYQGAARDAAKNGSAEACPESVPSIVISVNQWESITRSIAGACFNIKSIVSGVDVDPHEFEPLPSDIEAMQNANILVVNGLGYDDWAIKAASGAKGGQKLINIGELTRKSADDSEGDINTRTIGDNPHIWFDIETIDAYANVLLSKLSENNTQAELFNKNYNALLSRLNVLRDKIANDDEISGSGFVMSESLPYYLANDMHLVDKTPEGFLNAINNESEPTIVDISSLLDVIKSGQVQLVFINIQEESSATEQMESAASSTNVKVVKITEQVPVGQDLLDWLGNIVDEVAKN